MVLWAWSPWASSEALADGGGVPRTDLSVMLTPSDAGPEESSGTADSQGPAVASAPNSDGELEDAFTALVTALAGGDAEALAQATRLLARTDLSPAHRARLQAVLSAASPTDAVLPAATGPAIDPAAFDDVDALLEKLGENNTFLHGAEGRALGRRALVLIAKLKDEPALDAGTKLLERCMRGPIERGHVDAIAFVDEAYKQHKVRADRVLCDPASLVRSRSHVVGRGESLSKIATQFRKEGVAIDETSLAILNRIHNANAIRPGQRIRCPIDPIHAVLEKKSFLLAVYVGDRVLRLYWAGHGADDKTPVTEFVVLDKLKDPDWYSPDGQVYPAGSPENILGRYFLKFDNPSFTGFGAHGTPRPETVGTMSSMGCIRMYDADIEELYRLLPRKAKVEVRDSK
ncbi:MAG: L,D-transpeptidase family protein [Planctomycetota bacterium]